MAMVGPGDPNILQIKLGVLGRLGLFFLIEGRFFFPQKKENLEGKVLKNSRKSKIDFTYDYFLEDVILRMLLLLLFLLLFLFLFLLLLLLLLFIDFYPPIFEGLRDDGSPPKTQHFRCSNLTSGLTSGESEAQHLSPTRRRSNNPRVPETEKGGEG